MGLCISICLCICVGVAPGQAYSHIGSTANATNKTKTVPAPIVHVFAKSYLKAKTDHKNEMSRFQSDYGVTKYPHTMVYTVFIVHFLCLSSTIAFKWGANVWQICWEWIMALLTLVQTDSLVLFKNSLLSLLSSWWALPCPGQIVASLKCQPWLLCVLHTPINHMHGGSQLVVVFLFVIVFSSHVF